MQQNVVTRKAVCVEEWDPTPSQWDYLLSLQTPEDRELIQGFRFVADSKRSMVARIMLQSCAVTCLGLQFGEAKFGRTLEGRPYVSNTAEKRPGFNLNLSHHGDWVFLGSEERGVIGVDVVTTKAPRAGEDAETFLLDFEDQLTPWEWVQVRRNGPADASLYFAFFIFWALKESYIKAVGLGFGFTLKRAEFTVEEALLTPEGWAEARARALARPGSAELRRGCVEMAIDGERRPEWRVELGVLGDPDHRVPSHVIAAAIGPHAQASPSLRDALGAVQDGLGGGEEEGEWMEVECVKVEALLSGGLREEYVLRGAPSSRPP